MKYIFLQYIRAVAAYSVVLYHAGYYISSYRSDDAYSTAFGHEFGTFGIFIFFALSGFLMAVQLKKNGLNASRFLLHRVLRIYPIFWIICGVKILLGWPFGNFTEFDPLTLFLSPVGDRHYILGVEWTLVYEICFYICMAFIILIRANKYVFHIGFAWLILICLMCFLYPPYSPQLLTNPFSLPLSSTCSAFAAGLLIPDLLKRRMIKQSLLPIGAFLLALGRVTYLAPFENILAGIGCAAIVAWGATIMDDVTSRSPVLAKLGDWSFVTYMIHVPILTALLTASSLVGGSSKIWWMSIATVVVVSSLGGFADVWLYERLKSWGDRRANWTRAALCGGFVCLFAGSILFSNNDFSNATKVPDDLSTLRDVKSADDLRAGMLHAGYTLDNRLLGSLDVLLRQNGDVLAGGWVNDPQDVFNRTNLLLLVAGAPPVPLFPRDYRGDVLNAFGPKGFLAPVGFYRTIGTTLCSPGVGVVVIAISERSKIYQKLDSHICPA